MPGGVISVSYTHLDVYKRQVLGSHVTLGWGCSVIGDIRIADHVIVGAGCVLVKSVSQEGAHAAGVPGRVLGVGNGRKSG